MKFMPFFHIFTILSYWTLVFQLCSFSHPISKCSVDTQDKVLLIPHPYRFWMHMHQENPSSIKFHFVKQLHKVFKNILMKWDEMTKMPFCAIKTCICKTVDKNITLDCTRSEVRAAWITLKSLMCIRCGFFPSCFFRDWFLADLSASFRFAPFFSLVCTFLSDDLSFSTAFFGPSPLGFSFYCPLTDLKFLLGPLAKVMKVGWGGSMARAFENLGCLRHYHCPCLF